MSILRVLIVDDQEVVRQGLAVILRQQADIQVVGSAANGQEAIDLAAKLTPDVVLMDLKMPVRNGIQATRAIVQALPTVKVVVLTTYDGDEWVFDAIRAGAGGYLLKDSDSAEIVGAVRGAAAGEVRLDPAIAGRVLGEFRRLSTFTPQAGGQGARQADDAAANEPLLSPLTEREAAVLQEMVRGKNNAQIAAELCLAEGTVKNYVSSIIGKLQANDRTQAAWLALKRGLARL